MKRCSFMPFLYLFIDINLFFKSNTCQVTIVIRLLQRWFLPCGRHDILKIQRRIVRHN